MAIVSVPATLLPQSIKTQAAGLGATVCANIGAATSATVSASLVPLTAQVTTISGNLNTLTTVVADVTANSVSLATVQTISGQLSTDISNLDLSLTNSIVNTFSTTGTSVTGGMVVAIPPSASGFIIVQINGVQGRIPFFLG